jgi:predicted aminopeptidase
MRRGRIWTVAALAAGLLAAQLGGCATLADGPVYYWQSMVGHLSMMQRAAPIDRLLADPATDAQLKDRLERVREIRSFASRELGLPDNRSYTLYADLQRPFVVWNVFATRELSMKLQQWCFPVAGCVSYRGYYDRDEAERFADRLREQGLEVHLGGVPAYSTLGWFNDPVLSTFIRYPDGELARLIFHELAHQVVYVKGDTTFNESFATAVEEAGVQRWLAHRADPRLEQAYRVHSERRRDFVALLRRHRAELERVYAASVSDEEKRRGKAAVFAALQADYRVLRDSWGGFAGYDRWFGQRLTNAHLASVGTYTDLLPSFRAMLEQHGGDMAAFFEAVRELATLPRDERDVRLARYAGEPVAAESVPQQDPAAAGADRNG